MILPMSVFFLVVAILGGFTILSGGSNRGAKHAPLGFSMLFAGVGYCGLALILYPLAFYFGTVAGFVLLFFAPFAGSLAGAVFGYRKGLKRMATVEM